MLPFSHFESQDFVSKSIIVNRLQKVYKANTVISQMLKDFITLNWPLIVFYVCSAHSHPHNK